MNKFFAALLALILTVYSSPNISYAQTTSCRDTAWTGQTHKCASGYVARIQVLYSSIPGHNAVYESACGDGSYPSTWTEFGGTCWTTQLQPMSSKEIYLAKTNRLLVPGCDGYFHLYRSPKTHSEPLIKQLSISTFEPGKQGL